MVTPHLQVLIDAVASPIRREILWMTWDTELSVGEIGAAFDITGPTLSSHLAVLRDAGLITLRVDGNFRRYRVDQDAVRALVPFLAANDRRWEAADDLSERDLATAGALLAVVVEVAVPVPPADAFADFTDEDRYARWLGVPVSIRDGRFRATMEWGTEIRGTYEVVHPPDLVAMRWDFDDGAVPLPGRTPLVGYLRVHPDGAGSRVVVHQLAHDSVEAEWLTNAWSMVLGRYVEATAGSGPPAALRPRRPKKRG